MDANHNSPLDTLNVLSRNLVVQHMCDIVLCNLLTCTALVNTNSSDSDRPSCVSDTETKIGVVCLLVLSRLHVVDNFRKQAEDVGFQCSRSQQLEEWFQVDAGLNLGRCRYLALMGPFNGL